MNQVTHGMLTILRANNPRAHVFGELPPPGLWDAIPLSRHYARINPEPTREYRVLHLRAHIKACETLLALTNANTTWSRGLRSARVELHPDNKPEEERQFWTLTSQYFAEALSTGGAGRPYMPPLEDADD